MRSLIPTCLVAVTAAFAVQAEDDTPIHGVQQFSPGPEFSLDELRANAAPRAAQNFSTPLDIVAQEIPARPEFVRADKDEEHFEKV